jgi:hypothetical protein
MYITSWFLFDAISVIPFDLLFRFGGFNRLARLARIGKIYKLVRMTRLTRVLKILKERNKLVRYINEVLRINAGFERLLFMIVIFCIMQHIAACLWVFVGRFDLEGKDNWVYH